MTHNLDLRQIARSEGHRLSAAVEFIIPDPSDDPAEQAAVADEVRAAIGELTSVRLGHASVGRGAEWGALLVVVGIPGTIYGSVQAVAALWKRLSRSPRTVPLLSLGAICLLCAADVLARNPTLGPDDLDLRLGVMTDPDDVPDHAAGEMAFVWLISRQDHRGWVYMVTNQGRIVHRGSTVGLASGAIVDGLHAPRLPAGLPQLLDDDPLDQ